MRLVVAFAQSIADEYGFSVLYSTSPDTIRPLMLCRYDGAHLTTVMLGGTESDLPLANVCTYEASHMDIVNEKSANAIYIGYIGVVRPDAGTNGPSKKVVICAKKRVSCCQANSDDELVEALSSFCNRTKYKVIYRTIAGSVWSEDGVDREF